MKNKKIIIAGGTGFIGRSVAKYFSADNEIVILTRNVKRQENNAFGKFTFNAVTRNIRLVGWNGKDQGDWVNEIDGSDLVINLAGKSVNCRYTDTNKKEIFEQPNKGYGCNRRGNW